MFREEVINVQLANILTEKGLFANPECIISHKKMPDVLVFSQGIKIIIEGKSKDKKSLYSQAKSRVEDGLTEISIAIFYDKELYQSEDFVKLKETLLETKYSGVIYYQTDERVKEYNFNEINVDLFVEVLNNITNLILNTDILKNHIDRVQEELNELSTYAYNSNLHFNDQVVLSSLKEVLAIDDLQLKKEKSKKDIIQMALFVLFDAMIFQENIRNINSNIKSLSTAEKPLKTFFQNAWDEILEIDYKSIFQIAAEILKVLPNGLHETEEILKRLKNVAIDVINSGLLKKHDFMGRIYHKLLLKTTGEFYATYFTAVPSAYLLANLAIKTEHNKWNFDSIDFLKKYRLVDPACGSGTLLSASYTAMKTLFLTKVKDDEFSMFHKLMLEDSIHGWDILNYATHLTLTVLGLHNPKVLIDKSNIVTLPNGIDSAGKVCLGSLSLLENEFVEKGFQDPYIKKGMKGDQYSYTLMSDTDAFDLVIMNPPFSRSSKVNTKFGYSEKEAKHKMTKQLTKVVREHGLTGVLQAGLGAVFIYLGNLYLNNNGRIAFVIPRAFLTGVSWKKIREFLYDKYEIKYIISNHDAGDSSLQVDPWSWSESTDLGEVMVIAEKSDKAINDKEITYINFWNKPSNEIDAMFATDQVLNKKLNGFLSDLNFNTIRLRNKDVGAYYKLPQEEISGSWLAPCLFASPYINYLAVKLPKIIPTKKLSEYLVDDGVDIKQIKTSFDQFDLSSPIKIVYGQQSDMNTLFLKKEKIQNAKPKTENAYDLFKTRKSSFLLSERPHLANDSLIAMRAPFEVIATAFWELQFEEPNIENLMLLWFNSTLGLLMYLSSSTSSLGEIFKTKKGQLKEMNVIDFKFISEPFLEQIDNFYEENKYLSFDKLHVEFKKAYEGKGIRYKIDQLFLKGLGIDLDLTVYYKLLSEEPALTRKRL